MSATLRDYVEEFLIIIDRKTQVVKADGIKWEYSTKIVSSNIEQANEVRKILNKMREAVEFED